MSRITKEIAAVEFRANTRQASAAMESLRSEADKTRKTIDELDEMAKKGITTINVNGVVKELDVYRRELESLASGYDKAAKSLVKGVKAFDEAWAKAKMGNLESLTSQQLQSGINGGRTMLTRLGDSTDDKMKRSAIMSLTDESQKILARRRLDTEALIQTMERGGAVATEVLSREKKGLEEMLRLVPHGTEEWRGYNDQLTKVTKGLDAQTEAERRLRGEVTTREEALRVASARDEASRAEIIANINEEANKRHQVAATWQADMEREGAAMAELGKKRDEVRQKIEAEKQALAAADTERQKGVAARNEEIKKEQELAATLNETAKGKKAAYDEQVKTVSVLNSEISKLMISIADLNESQQQSTAATTASTEVDKKKAELQAELAKKEAERDKATEALAKAEGELKTATEAANEQQKKANEMQSASTKASREDLKAKKMLRGEIDNLKVDEENLTKAMQTHGTAAAEAGDRANAALAEETRMRQEAKNLEKESIDTIKQSIAVLEKENQTVATGSDEWKKNEQAIGDLNKRMEKLKQESSELRGEMMSLDEAKDLASRAGGDGFLATAKQMQQATQRLQQYRDELIQTIQAKQRDGVATDNEERELKELEKTLKDLRFENEHFNMTHQRMREIMANPKTATDLDELRAAIKRADGELKRMEQSLGSNNRQYKDFATEVKGAKNALKEMEGQAKATDSAFDKAWSRFKTYVSFYVSAAVAMQKVAATMGDLIDLSDKLGEVRKTTGFTADEVGHLTGELKKMDTRTALNGLLDLSVAAGQLGLKTEEDVLGFTEAANKLMVALPEMGKEGATEMLKVALATGEIDKIRKQMEQGLIEGSSATAVAMEKVGSTIDRLRANSAATAPAITDFVKRVGAVGAQSGITIDQVAALGSTVDALGMRVEMSATALSRMIPAIRNNAFDVAKAIGMAPNALRDMFDEAGGGMKAMLAIFQHIKDAGMGEDDIETMLGLGSMKEVMRELNQQGARAGIVFSGLSQNVDVLRKQLDIASEAYKENTAIQQEYQKMNETTAAKWARLKNQFEEMFVSDHSQRFLGRLIDGLRKLVDWIAEDGPIVKALKVIAAYWAAMRMELGATVVSAKDAFKNLAAAIGAGVNQLGIFTRATAKAREEYQKMDATTKANIWGAVITALGMVAYKIYDVFRSAKEAAAEIGRFNEKLSQEKSALDALFDPLYKANVAQEERSKLITEINSKYGKYLGFMLTETNSAIQLADAHALIAKRIREEAYEKRILSQEDSVRKEYDEDINARYGGLQSGASQYVKGNTTGSEVADAIKNYIDRNLRNVDNDFYLGALRESNESVQKLLGGVDKLVERMIADGKLTRDAANGMRGVAFQYLSVAKEQSVAMERATANTRSELRSIRNGIQGDVNATLNDLVNGVKNFNAPRAGGAPLLPVAPKNENARPSWGERMAGTEHNWQGNTQTQANITAPLPSERATVDTSNIEEVRRYVDAQDQLRNYLQANAGHIDEQTRKTAEMYLDSTENVEKLRNLLPHPRAGSGGRAGEGGAGTNIWGSNAPADSTDYSLFDENELVARRNQMDKFKSAVKPDTDIKAVLAEDAALMKAIQNGLSADWKSVIAWYNTERKKIEKELHSERFSTNEGHRMADAKTGRRRNPLYESDYALAELDRYYSRRQEALEKARATENMTEEMYNRQTEMLEQEHLRKRSDLRQSFTGKLGQAQEATFRQWWSRLEQQMELDHVEWATVEGEWNRATAAQIGRNNLRAQQDLTKMNDLTVKHLNQIAKIVDRERPYDGITANLRDNLTRMDILFADMDKANAEAIGPNGDGTRKFDEAAYVAAGTQRLKFLLTEAEHAYDTTIDDVLRRMGEQGMQTLADTIAANPAMKEALMAQLRNAYDAVQEAIKKESAMIKKQTDIWWADIAPGQTDSRKSVFDRAISQVGLQEDQVRRANTLIGAGYASERVADKLAITQMRLRLQMQETYYLRMRQIGEARIKQLESEGRMEDAAHLRQSLNLAKVEEIKKLEEQRVAIANQLAESQAKLYKELKSWSDLLTSGLTSVFEAMNTGNKEYYNERAKLELQGRQPDVEGNDINEKQTYVIIEDAGTSDATAHYEELDALAALERQHQIERDNATSDAWKQVMDDINMKMSETITDQLNAMLQNAATEANTSATLANTQALYALTLALGGGTTGEMLDAAELPNLVTPPFIDSPEKLNQAMSNLETYTAAYTEQSIAAQESIAAALPSGEGGAGGGGLLMNISDEQVTENVNKMGTLATEQISASDLVTKKLSKNAGQQAKDQNQADTQMVKGTKNAYAVMTAAANMYGIAYQAMSNDNMDTAQKFEMIAIQAAGNAAITALTADFSEKTGEVEGSLPAILAKCLGISPIWGTILFAGLSALLGGMMGMAASAVGQSKSEIAQVTGANNSNTTTSRPKMNVGRLKTGMLTYAEGNVDAFTDPASLTPGRSYNVDGADGRTYHARYTGSNPGTHITSGPEFHLVGEKGSEAIIDARTTRNIRMNEPEIWRAIKTLSGGAAHSGYGRVAGRGMRAFADGNIDDLDDLDVAAGGDATGGSGMGKDQMIALQQALDRNSAVMERLEANGIHAYFDTFGKGGLVNTYDEAKKVLARHGEAY